HLLVLSHGTRKLAASTVVRQRIISVHRWANGTVAAMNYAGTGSQYLGSEHRRMTSNHRSTGFDIEQ
ncbi:MAG: hypothetical protein ACRDTV_02550, partial [Mycobacterium sp.]